MKLLLWVAAIGALSLIVLSIYSRPAQPALPKQRLSIGYTAITAEVADEPRERFLGLSRRPPLSAGQGMLFVFEQPDYHAFVMREMSCPLDLVWIRDHRIVGFSLDLSPEGKWPSRTYQPLEPCDKVLEVPAGTVNAAAWRIGDELKIN
jgi:uncharacterized membrane protein (UPF0127 family)